MSKTARSPFAGMKLTDQTTLSKPAVTDQQLFVAKSAPPAATINPPTHLPRNEGSQEPRKVGTQAPSNPQDVATQVLLPTIDHLKFDINEAATEKNSYMFSEAELWALRDVESELERT